jgi:hypothetical protein
MASNVFFLLFAPLDTFQDPKIGMPAEQGARDQGWFYIRVQNTHEMDLGFGLVIGHDLKNKFEHVWFD